jgi:hypothetical protein
MTQATYQIIEHLIGIVVTAILFQLWTNVEIASKTHVGTVRKEFSAKILQQRTRLRDTKRDLRANVVYCFNSRKNEIKQSIVSERNDGVTCSSHL